MFSGGEGVVLDPLPPGRGESSPPWVKKTCDAPEKNFEGFLRGCVFRCFFSRIDKTQMIKMYVCRRKAVEKNFCFMGGSRTPPSPLDPGEVVRTLPLNNQRSLNTLTGRQSTSWKEWQELANSCRSEDPPSSSSECLGVQSPQVTANLGRTHPR